ncbi:YlbL family protein [Microbacterium gorillae]|uniref:YlbL family protein n=1 Tax=Microbacterium gorillae TaxID=1231063 RepID=UPI000A7C4E43|nr:S16 family serine protease [Microbacterium gorillae]
MSLGLIALAVALIAMFTLSLLPSGFVIQQPGPVVNTLGETTGEGDAQVPLIDVPDRTEYPTSGTLSLVTVQVVGNREGTPSWLEIASAWFDPSLAVLPLDAVFPLGQTTDERQAEDAQMMTDSQTAAAAAAFTELGEKAPIKITVAADPAEGTAAHGLLRQGDVLTKVDGAAITSTDQVQKAVTSSEGKPVTFTIDRDGSTADVAITPKLTDTTAGKLYLVGVSMGVTYELPTPVHIQLNDIGGPSAGMMFALGIIDTLTPGDMTGGAHIAGTGTIDGAGDVGAIGGIRQKMYGAERAGNDYFIAPASNCDEVVGHVPSGLRVFSSSTLSESVHIVETIASGKGLDALPTCHAGQ